MRILRPEEIALLRMGYPCIPANGGGGGGSTSSNSSQATTTTNTDKRIANGPGGLVAQDGSAITLNSTSNIESLSDDVVKAAFDYAAVTDAKNGAGFSKLLDVADKLTTKTSDTATALSSRFQDNVLDAFERAKTSTSGSIDQKTMIVLAVTAAAALAFMNARGK